MALEETGPSYGIIMGSADTDLPTMHHVGLALQEMGLQENVDYEERAPSVHRLTELAIEYAKTAEARGIKVIIAGAGGSAHLPGMVASETIVPVLGVAITSSPDVMNRALGSNIGMPKGKPLATFQGEAGAFNAGLFAVRMSIAAGNIALRGKYLEYEARLVEQSAERDSQLLAMGSTTYMGMRGIPRAK
jgi:5-(carboxyamino)imidazole ribonucleotide mutase